MIFFMLVDGLLPKSDVSRRPNESSFGGCVDKRVISAREPVRYPALKFGVGTN